MTAPIKLSGYTRVEKPFAQFQPLTDWVVIAEHLNRSTASGITVPDRGNAVIGTVLKSGDWASQRDGITPGDTVIFTEWQGGRWAFLDPDSDDGEIRVLIMDAADVILRIPAED